MGGDTRIETPRAPGEHREGASGRPGQALSQALDAPAANGPDRPTRVGGLIDTILGHRQPAAAGAKVKVCLEERQPATNCGETGKEKPGDAN
jgi:hypothetical protein